MIALWRLNTPTGPATFDFMTWLVMVKKYGAKQISIDDENVRTTKFPEDVMRKRIESIIMPAPALAGLPCYRSRHGSRLGSYWMGELARLGQFERLKSVLPPGTARYTVTLRRSQHHAYRNSDPELWREFAKRIDAVVIEDYADEPIGLHERMALYAGAEMNFGVTNGPVFMIFLTTYPVTMFNCAANAPLWRQHGIKEGKQLPWARSNQRLIWEAPTMDNLLAAVPA